MPGLLSASGMSKRIPGTGIFSRPRPSPEAALVETSSEMAGLAWQDFPSAWTRTYTAQVA
jgi:hypothetical protein